jgi:cold shock CspA family protein
MISSKPTGGSCEVSRMAEGTVLWYSPELGYGFVRHDDPEDVRATRKIFVDSTNIAGNEALQTGDKVAFERVEGEQGLEARNVIRTGSLGPPTERGPKKLRPGRL